MRAAGLGAAGAAAGAVAGAAAAAAGAARGAAGAEAAAAGVVAAGAVAAAAAGLGGGDRVRREEMRVRSEPRPAGGAGGACAAAPGRAAAGARRRQAASASAASGCAWQGEGGARIWESRRHVAQLDVSRQPPPIARLHWAQLLCSARTRAQGVRRAKGAWRRSGRGAARCRGGVQRGQGQQPCSASPRGPTSRARLCDAIV